MSKIAIVTDTSCDLPLELFEEYNIKRASMKINFGEMEFTDQVDIDQESFYQKLKDDHKALPRTTQPQTADFVTIFNDLKSAGYEEIFALHISAKMSGTAQAAQLASEMVTDIKVHVYDTMQVGPALGLFVYACASYLKKGKTADQLTAFIEKMIDQNPILELFTVDSMKYLVKNGRVGRAKGLAAGLLKIKPILTISQGEIAALDKARGDKALQKRMVNLATDKINELEKPLLFLTWGDNDYQQAAENIGEKIDNATTTEIKFLRGRLAPTIGCHSGPEVYSLTIMDWNWLANAE